MSDPFLGEIRLFAFPRVPDGWLACNGSSLSISNYDALYAVIGTTFGGDGVQTFNLPDLRGRVPLGQGTTQDGTTYVIGELAGEDEHTLIANEIPAHSHALLSSTVPADTATPGPTVHLATASTGNLDAPIANAGTYSVMAPCLVAAGQSVPHNNIMPTVVGNYCICIAGIFPSPG
ncbi:tail fiber protein [Bradyrhizobium sp. STM 3809]|uniref:phage tail protein n=1 Tax=Bradyrhizobium sp. STM 3809 TaxID=551936 RepID=UPI0002407BAB|nr:tail fiber protein [Bradyrhizobium sp. STM 3809]CCD97793.1 Phage Tail Collar [Bradyrhizobium sp. STM 3809]